MATNYVLMSSYAAAQFAALKRTWLNHLADLPYPTLYLGLLKAAPVFSVPPVMADLTGYECGYPSYARQSVTTFAAPVANGTDCHQDLTANAYTFTCTGSGSSDTYQGSFLADAASGGNLWFVTLANNAVGTAFNAAGVSIQVQPRLTEAGYSAYP